MDKNVSMRIYCRDQAPGKSLSLSLSISFSPSLPPSFPPYLSLSPYLSLPLSLPISLLPSLLPSLSLSLPPYLSLLLLLSLMLLFLSLVAGISVTEHLELNIVPLAVRLTEKFYQTMQDFFLPRQEGETRESTSDPDHSYIFGGVKRKPSLVCN